MFGIKFNLWWKETGCVWIGGRPVQILIKIHKSPTTFFKDFLKFVSVYFSYFPKVYFSVLVRELETDVVSYIGMVIKSGSHRSPSSLTYGSPLVHLTLCRPVELLLWITPIYLSSVCAQDKSWDRFNIYGTPCNQEKKHLVVKNILEFCDQDQLFEPNMKATIDRGILTNLNELEW